VVVALEDLIQEDMGQAVAVVLVVCYMVRLVFLQVLLILLMWGLAEQADPLLLLV
jgi:hypothetical protein